MQSVLPEIFSQTADIPRKVPLFLAPMEEITNYACRNISRKFGADVVYSEFINSDALIRNCKKAYSKLIFYAHERPFGIQIYGQDLHSMTEAAKIAASYNPDLIDINAGCWVKKISHRGAGAGLLRNIQHFQEIVSSICRSVSVPVTVKTRLGWDENNINIIEVSKILQDCGVQAITVHCRTRSQKMAGTPQWQWIEKIKSAGIFVPIIINGGILSIQDAKNVIRNTPADGLMIARGAIGNPWLFQEIKCFLSNLPFSTISLSEKAACALEHFILHIQNISETKAVYSFRKFLSSYISGFPNVSVHRTELMQLKTKSEIIHLLTALIERK